MVPVVTVKHATKFTTCVFFFFLLFTPDFHFNERQNAEKTLFMKTLLKLTKNLNKWIFGPPGFTSV